MFKTKWGPKSGRKRTSADPYDWSRFDLPGEATLYGASERQGAYAEVLAPLRPSVAALCDLAREMFDDVVDDEDPIFDEWAARSHMLPGSMPKVWRIERGMAKINVISEGWFVDLEAPRTLAALRPLCAPLLREARLDDLDVSAVRSNNRRLTCGIAERLAQTALDDGSLPLGIRYLSRLGSDWECWALFPHILNGGVAVVTTEPVDSPHDADLEKVAQLFDLRFH